MARDPLMLEELGARQSWSGSAAREQSRMMQAVATAAGLAEGTSSRYRCSDKPERGYLMANEGQGCASSSSCAGAVRWRLRGCAGWERGRRPFRSEPLPLPSELPLASSPPSERAGQRPALTSRGKAAISTPVNWHGLQSVELLLIQCRVEMWFSVAIHLYDCTMPRHTDRWTGNHSPSSNPSPDHLIHLILTCNYMPLQEMNTIALVSSVESRAHVTFQQ